MVESLVDPLTSARQRWRIMQRHHGRDAPQVKQAEREVKTLATQRQLDEIRSAVQRECDEQGLPFHITDETTLGTIAELLRAPSGNGEAAVT